METELDLKCAICFIACETQVVCESKILLDAVIDLITCYYVFDISYPKGMQVIFLTLCIMYEVFTAIASLCTETFKKVAV